MELQYFPVTTFSVAPFQILAFLVIALLLWRIMTFTMLPAFSADDPKLYPYWVPGIGHLFAFILNSGELFSRAIKYFSNSREPFAINLAGQTFYIITRPDDVSAVYQNSSTLSFDIFGQEIMKVLGVTGSAISSMYRFMDPKKALYPNPQGKPLSRLARDFHILQFYPENNLSDVVKELMKSLNKALQMKNLSDGSPLVIQTCPNAVKVSLFRMTSSLWAESGAAILFGSKLLEIEPNFASIYLEYDYLGWQVLFKYPALLSRKVRATKTELVRALEKYFDLPMEERNDSAWFTQTLEKEMRNVGIENRDIATMMLTIYWGMITSNRKGGFWMVAYLLFNPKLIEIIKEETALAITGDSIDLNYIANHCPRLRSIVDEVLRLSAYSASTRYLSEDTIIGGKKLRKGNRIMMPFREMHRDEAVWGSNAHDFDPERFLRNPKLRRFNMTFGGGATQCPGKHLAAQSMMLFAVEIFGKFHITLDPADQAFPEPDLGEPVLGLAEPKKQMDVTLRLAPRRI